MDNNLNDYFEAVPDWGGFEVLNNEISGNIPVTKIRNWKNIPAILDDPFFNDSNNQLIYRGQRRFDWSLSPSLGRLDENGIINDRIADDQLKMFRRAIRGRINDFSLVDDGQEDELWSIGQHHGLMTPLLDWTYSPYVSMFFAFIKPDRKAELENPYRVIYAINKSYIENLQDSEIRLLEPRKDEYGRLVNQAGLFVFSPYKNTIENELINTLNKQAEEGILDIDVDNPNQLAKYICKIYIANEERWSCLCHLRKMNVHHASLFPDIIGASEYTNELISETYQVSKELAMKKQMSEATIEEIPLTEEMQEIDQEEETEIKKVLQQHKESSQVEPARINLIAQELAVEFKKHQVVDWESRESIQARLKNIARVTLRKYGYPINIRENVIDEIFQASLELLGKEND